LIGFWPRGEMRLAHIRHSKPIEETFVIVFVGIGMTPWMITRITPA
jgi:hypothetical protein